MSREVVNEIQVPKEKLQPRQQLACLAKNPQNYFSFTGVGRNQAMERNEIKEFVDDLRTEWKSLWQNRIDDKVRAEGIAKHDYSKLLVEQGTVIRATRDYKPLEFFDIVENRLGCEAAKAGAPNPAEGGWGKFVRNNIKNQKKTTIRHVPPKPTQKKGQQQKKGGRGWLHAKLL